MLLELYFEEKLCLVLLNAPTFQIVHYYSFNILYSQFSNWKIVYFPRNNYVNLLGFKSNPLFSPITVHQGSNYFLIVHFETIISVFHAQDVTRTIMFKLAYFRWMFHDKSMGNRETEETEFIIYFSINRNVFNYSITNVGVAVILFCIINSYWTKVTSDDENISKINYSH